MTTAAFPAEDRYDRMPVRRAKGPGLDLPTISLGLWQNFGVSTAIDRQREIIHHAFDSGITHLDLANNYGPPVGAAEENLGSLLRGDLGALRDELVITTKAGYRAGPGPYGEGGSRKYLLSSLDASLRRLGLDHVDIFYSHRYDPSTPLTETLGALRTAVDSGRARYAGISSYSAQRTREALAVADQIGLRLSVHQPSYSMINRWIEQPGPDGESLLDVIGEAGLAVVVFSPLAQGMLTDRYLGGIPADSRGAKGASLKVEYLTASNLDRIRSLNAIAERRGQTLAQLAITWVLRDPRVTTALVGASSVAQLDDTLTALDAPALTDAEVAEIDVFARDGGVNLWGARSSDL